MHKYCENIKMLNPQRNAHSPYSETVPLNEPSGLLYGCDVTAILYIGRKRRYSAITAIPRLQ